MLLRNPGLILHSSRMLCRTLTLSLLSLQDQDLAAVRNTTLVQYQDALVQPSSPDGKGFPFAEWAPTR